MSHFQEILFPNDNGVVVRIQPAHPFTRSFIGRVDSETALRRVVSELLKRSLIKGNILDAGCWIGDNTIPWSLNTQGLVYAIDPSLANLDFITDLVKLNSLKNVVTIKAVLAECTKLVWSPTSIEPQVGEFAHLMFSDQTISPHPMQTTTIDELARTATLTDLGYIHLDVEGFEGKVIAGARRVFHDFRPICDYEQHLNSDNWQALAMSFLRKVCKTRSFKTVG